MNSPILIGQTDDYFSALEIQYGFKRSQKSNIEYFIPSKEIGDGYISLYSPCRDIEISVIRLNLSRPIIMDYEGFDCMFEATYCMGGNIAYSEKGVVDTCLRQNELSIYLKQHSKGMMMYPSGQDVFAVSLLAKGDFLEDLPYQQECAACRDCTYRDLVHYLMNPCRTNIQIHNLFSQICSNNIDDLLRPVFLESTAKMILSCLWQSSVVDTITNNCSSKYSSSDQKAIREAESILSYSYSEPPTISELAKTVALNEYKLKNGFREKYGKTIYEYVNQARMRNAKILLENDDLSISQIAYMVGYINTSHFARAFRKQYGRNPSDFRSGV